MIFTALVEYTINSYMAEEAVSGKKHFTVDAKDEKEAEKKLKDYYDEKSDSYGDSYSIDVEIFEHIK